MGPVAVPGPRPGVAVPGCGCAAGQLSASGGVWPWGRIAQDKSISPYPSLVAQPMLSAPLPAGPSKIVLVVLTTSAESLETSIRISVLVQYTTYY